MNRPIAMVAALFAVFSSLDARPQMPSASDSSPYKTRLVTVDKGVKLEVLDWGGTGRALVLLAGPVDFDYIGRWAPELGVQSLLEELKS